MLRRATLLTALPVVSLAAQALTEVEVGEGPGLATVAFDSGRGRAVAFEAQRLRWEWTGSRWVSLPGAPLPATYGWTLFDDRRQRLLVVGYTTAGGTSTVQVQEWDGCTWGSVVPMGTSTGTLPPFWAVAMDPRRGRAVVVGSRISEWDGQRWFQIDHALGGSAPARDRPALAFDEQRQRVVLFGGGVGGVFANDCWCWDGAQWTAVPSASAPAGRVGAALHWDPTSARCLLFGGLAAPGPVGDTWALGAAGWTQLQPVHSPAPTVSASMFTDAGGLLLVTSDQRWRWTGADWQLIAPHGEPALRNGHRFVWHGARNEAVLFGGGLIGGTLDDTWTWNGRWQRQQPASSPSRRHSYGLAEDVGRGELVLFGGWSGQVELGDTWTWNGTTWQQRQPITVPPPRISPVMVADPGNNGVLLFGGLAAAGGLGDQWHWNGTDWQLVNVAGPSARWDAAAAYDPLRQRTVLFGGFAGATAIPTTWHTDTWEWDGSQWLPMSFPSTRQSDAQVVFDPARHGIVRFAVNGTDVWTGSAWVPVAFTPVSGASSRKAMTMDPGRGVLLHFPAGRHLGLVSATPFLVDGLGAGCGRDGAPALTVRAAPRLGESDFGVDLQARQAGAPALLALGLAQQNQHLGNGCFLLVDQPVAVAPAVANASGWCRYLMPVPSDPALRGLSFFAQAGVFAPGSSVLGGATLTAALRIQVGA